MEAILEIREIIVKVIETMRHIETNNETIVFDNQHIVIYVSVTSR